MKFMKRITPDMTEAAYAATGLKPSPNFWIRRDYGEACPVGALMCEKGEWLDSFGRKPFEEAAKALDLGWGTAKDDEDYLRGFTKGFDNPDPDMTALPKPAFFDPWSEGLADGQAVARTCEDWE